MPECKKVLKKDKEGKKKKEHVRDYQNESENSHNGKDWNDLNMTQRI